MNSSRSLRFPAIRRHDMELFDKQFVHFMWDDELKGKKVFVASEIDDLVRAVNENREGHKYNVHKSNNPSWPFQAELDCEPSAFAYYDPNYEIKKAFNEGKTIQYKALDTGRWCDFDPKLGPCLWNDTTKYRVKPEEKKWIVYLARQGDEHCYLTACTEDNWEDIQKNRNVKTKLFIGANDEVQQWYESRKKFAEVIKAWEDGKQIQFRRLRSNDWLNVSMPIWDLSVEYRVKPEKKYRPYESPAEMIVDFIDRFKVNCPSYCEPLIWVKGKGTDNRYLVFAFCENGIEFNDDEPLGFEPLFDCYTYLDGSPVGMTEEE